MQNYVLKPFDLFFVRSWWVFLFAIFCLMLYEQGVKNGESDYLKLQTQLLDLRKQKDEALAIQENLTLQLNSQSDPAWIELILIKRLGVAPEGKSKILFKNPE